MRTKAGLVLGLVILLTISQVNASSDCDIFVVNSEDWVDVYSAATYANLQDKDFNYLTSTEHINRLPSQLSPGKICLFESEKKPFVKSYAQTLRAAGFDVEETITGDNLNLELAEKTQTKKFILVDETYGYNALSVIAYAKLTGAYVLVADEDNIGEISDLLEARDAEVLAYGHIRSQISAAINDSVSEFIDNGDKFEDNIEIVRIYGMLEEVNQVTLTDGSFMELGVMKGVEPVLFIGRDSVPDSVVDYVKESSVRVGVLVGNDLVPNAQSLKAQTGISVFFKFGQGTASGLDSSRISGLDIYYFPQVEPEIAMESITYNLLTEELEVVYDNSGDAAAYVKSTIKVYLGDDLEETLGDSEPFLVDAGESRGITYSLESMGSADSLNAEVIIQYGESKRSQDRLFEDSLEIEISEIEDNSRISLKNAAYDKNKKTLTLSVKNEGPICYVKAEIEVGGEVLESETAEISEGEEKTLSYDLTLTDGEIPEEVGVKVAYGSRRDFLTKTLDTQTTLEVADTLNLQSIMYPAVIVLLLGVIAVLFSIVLRRDNAGGEKKKKGL